MNFSWRGTSCAIGLLGKEESTACQEQHKLLGKSSFPPDRPATTHYSCPTQPFIHLQTLIEQLPLLSTAGDTRMYKAVWRHNCSGRRCERGQAEEGFRWGPSLERVGCVPRVCDQRACLVKIHIPGPRGSPQGIQYRMSCWVQIPAVGSEASFLRLWDFIPFFFCRRRGLKQIVLQVFSSSEQFRDKNTPTPTRSRQKIRTW